MENLKIDYLHLKQIEPSATNPRKNFDPDSLNELAKSISEKGVLQPIIVRERKSNTGKNVNLLIGREKFTVYELVAGERRFRASMLLYSVNKELDKIPAIVRELTDDEVLEIQIIENLQRKDVHPMEEAAGFKNIIELGKINTHDLAIKVGKTPGYITQRLKLNDLIDELQQAFYDEFVRISDALKLARLSQEVQKEIYDDYFPGLDEGEVFVFENHILRQYTGDLSKATFDIADEKLIPEVGSCTNCVFNSSANKLLFPDLDNNSICSNLTCFNNKRKIDFDEKLKHAINDPEIVLVDDSYSKSEKVAELKKHHTVYQTWGSVKAVIIEVDQKPELQEFLDDYEDKEEAETAYHDALNDYTKQIKEYGERIKSPAARRCFFVSGSRIGEFGYVELTSSGSDSQINGDNSSVDENHDLRLESVEIQNKLKRSKEIDENKIWEQAVKLLNKDEYLENIKKGKNQTALTQPEFDFLIFQLCDACGINYDIEEYIKESFANEDGSFQNVDRKCLNTVLRLFMVGRVRNGSIERGFRSEEKAVMRLITHYFPNEVSNIFTSVREKSAKKQANYEVRLKEIETILEEKKKGQKKPGKKSKAVKS